MIVSNNRGDTIIEVLLATTVLAIVITGAYTLSNRALRVAQNSVERTEVSTKMREQMEVLRAMRNQQTPSWTELLSNSARQGSAPPANSNINLAQCQPTSGEYSIYLDIENKDVDDPSIISVYPNTGPSDDAYDDIFNTWIEVYNSNSSDYVDVVVRSCWEGIGSTGDQRSLLTMRLTK